MLQMKRGAIAHRSTSLRGKPEQHTRHEVVNLWITIESTERKTLEYFTLRSHNSHESAVLDTF